MDIIKKIIKYFSPPTMEMEVDGKRYKLVFVNCVAMWWTVKVGDLDSNKTIGYIELSDDSIVDRTVEYVATIEIKKLVENIESEKERENKRKESMKYYFGD